MNMREDLPRQDQEPFSDPILEKRINDLIESRIQERVEDAREFFDEKMLISGEAPQEMSARREQYVREVKNKNREHIRNQGRMIWLTNNFFAHFPGGMYRNQCQQLEAMDLGEEVRICGKPFREFYQNFDSVLKELRVESDQCAPIARSMSGVNTNPELVARVWVKLIDMGYKREDLWA